MTLPRESTLKIGDCTVDPAVDEISRQGTAIKVEPRAMRVLLYLAGRPGEVVSVEDLLDNVWTDVVVTPDSVYTTISALRRALGDDSRESRYIANVPRRGYRLVASVIRPSQLAVAPSEPPARPVPVTGAQAAAEEKPRHRQLQVQAALAAVVLAVLSYFAIERPWIAKPVQAPVSAAAPATPTLGDKSIVVLPFDDRSDRRDQRYLADGMADELVALLLRLPPLTVISRASSERFRGSAEDLQAIGVELGAAYVVSGTVRKEGNHVRVTARLVDSRSGDQVWAESYDGELGDILAVQDQIAVRIARALQITMTAETVVPRQHLKNSAAYKLYLRGLSAYDRQRPDMLSQAQGYFEQALALDASFLPAAEALALTHVAQAEGSMVIPRDGWLRAKRAAAAALRIDASSAPAHAVLGLVLAFNDFDWDAAEAEIGRALALNQRSPVVWDFAAQVAHVRGLTDEAQRRIGASLSLDSLNPYALQTLGYIFIAKGDLASAEQTYRKLAVVSPAFDGNHYYLALFLLQRGERDAALREAQTEVGVDARDAGLAIVYRALGRTAESDAALARLIPYTRDLWPNGIAAVYIHRGDADKAFAWLDRALELRDQELPLLIRADFFLGPLRGDPRYRALLSKMKLAH